MRSSSPFIANAVTATTGIARSSGSSLIQLVTSRPETCGKLDVHQDQIGAELAGEIERFDSRCCVPDGLVAMGFQQVAKELHVELVVFHDQDGFGHPALQSASQ